MWATFKAILEKLRDSKYKYAYICGVNFQYDLERTATKIYSSINELKNDQPCWQECGIVKIRIEVDKWEVNGTFY